MTEIEDHPSGWARTSVGEVAIYQNGRAFKPSDWGATGLPIIRIQNLNDPSANYNYSDKQHEKKFLIKNGDLLFAWSASLGAYLWQGQDAWLNQHIFRVDHTKTVDRQFLYHALTNITNDLYAKAHGSGMVHVTKGKFEETPIWLPPRNEQRRIVAKFEELFSELDKGIESLKAARAKLSVYRQAVLKHAFEGKLTAQWREENRGKLETPEQLLARIKQDREARYEQQLQEWKAAVKEWEEGCKSGKRPAMPGRAKTTTEIASEEVDEFPDIPENWSLVRLCQIAEIGSGISVSAARKPEDPLEVPYLRVANVQRGFLDLSEIKHMSIERSQLDHLQLKKWDVLFNEGGDRDKLGRGWIWQSEIAPCITQNHVFRASPYITSRGFNSKLLSYWANTFGQRYFEKVGKQTTNLASINKTVLSKFPVPLIPSEEQEELCKQIDQSMTTVDAQEQEIVRALGLTDALRQSILKKAFSGQLVPQDPDDEPASSLLERIKAEKATQTQNNTRAKRRGMTATA